MISKIDSQFEHFNNFLNENNYSKIVILCDTNTHEYCLPQFLGQMETTLPFEIIEIEPGEDMKTLETTAQLWQIMLEYECDRKTLMVNLGGGVIGDMGGFVASTYKRGIDFIQIPTTLLSMCDASIGGKTGIDFGGFKNCVGSFAEAKGTFVNPDFLKTLDYVELRSGFAEMLKHGLIQDRGHWNDLTAFDKLTAENLQPYIEISIRIKSEVVAKDFKEQDIRKTLNFGHTIGHAIEAAFLATQQPIPHGEAVAAGMITESYISFKSNLISEQDLNEVIKGIQTYFPTLDISVFSNELLLQWMKNDKKNKDGQLLFALINGIGSCAYDVQIDENLVEESLIFYKNLIN